MVREGDPSGPSPGSPLFRQFFLTPRLTNAGGLSFGAALSNTSGSHDTGIWSTVGGGIQYVSGEGGIVPGVPGGRFYWTNAGLLGMHAMSDTGRVAIHSGSYPFGSPNPANVLEGIWAGTPTDFQLLALEGQPGPGSLNTARYSSFQRPTTNDIGDVIFAASLRDEASGRFFGALIGDFGGVQSVVAAPGDSIAGFPHSLKLNSVSSPNINDNRQVVFAGTFENENDGTFSTSFLIADNGNLSLVAQLNDTAPGLERDQTLSQFFQPSINNRGHVAFASFIDGEGVTDANDKGIWIADEAGLDLVAREGQRAPGAESALRFLQIETPVFNDARQVVFESSLALEGTFTATGRGIWATTPRGNLKLIVRTGDQLDVAPNDLRTITSIGFLENAEAGLPTGFNNAGQVTFYAFFSDGTEGIFVSDLVAVPEPAGIALLVLAMSPLFAIRQLRRHNTTN